MNSEQLALWSKIRDFDIDGGTASLTFSKRLARENGWSRLFADRVVEEYRRFVFLCMIAGHKCTPSDEVDQAWHLHLVYTESYWSRMCGDVLPRPLHHGPTKGGQAEDDKFVDWYERTKQSYRTLFGEEPPIDIWPSSQARFANAGAWRRIDTSKFLMIPRSAWRRPVAGALAVGSLAGCGALAQTTGVDTTVIIIIALAIVIAVFMILAMAANAYKNHKSGHQDGGGCGSTGGSGCSSDSASSGCSSSGCSSGCGGGGCGGGGCGG